VIETNVKLVKNTLIALVLLINTELVSTGLTEGAEPQKKCLKKDLV
jgi:hypothetical protein